MYATGYKNIADQVLKETHKIDAILIITIKELSAKVNEVIRLYKASADQVDMVKNAVSSVIMDTVNQHIPCNAYSGMLSAVLLDDYRINPDISLHTASLVNDRMLFMVNHIHTKMRSVGKDTEYVLVSTLDSISGRNMVYAPYSIDLSNFRTIEFRFYSMNIGDPHEHNR